MLLVYTKQKFDIYIMHEILSVSLMQHFLSCWDSVWCDASFSIPEMTYNVFSGTLNPTHSLTPFLSFLSK